ncbi:hypothetical protein QWZ13_02945 [Reinekea marina]|uniref:hypothetical protein n=1 Tax=Reinekea marina TaxID=1310421 RepID=UPI0025B2FC06|nr:hypothetical protein [Reinekea marina]MDN3647868.1 hypothetical protein [Reinekea marina]
MFINMRIGASVNQLFAVSLVPVAAAILRVVSKRVIRFSNVVSVDQEAIRWPPKR